MKSSFSETEIFGQILSLYGDPVNQDAATGGITPATAFATLNVTADEINKNLIWSRLLLCRILNRGGSQYDKLAIVLRPRSLWLFNSSGKYADYDGNIADDVLDLPKKIVKIAPAYAQGDVIRIGTLPNLITINGWNEGFAGMAGGVNCSSFSFGGGFEFSSTNMSQVAYYDKNVDSRSRSKGNKVYVKICKEDGSEMFLPIPALGDEVEREEIPEGATIIE